MKRSMGQAAGERRTDDDAPSTPLPHLHADIHHLIDLRRRLHAFPELSNEEHRTASVIADEMRKIGLTVHEGIGGTGLVAIVEGHAEGPGVALRADIDALPITERTNLPYASCVNGRMHACGHDGHAAMLVGAARYLARTRRFAGRVYLIFQGAEERFCGAQRMLDEGLLERYPFESIFAVHNWPGLAAGAVVIQDGPVMAGTGEFELRFTAAGSHAAMPHESGDPIVAGSCFLMSAQQIVSRQLPPEAAAVVSVGSFHAGYAQNVIPTEALLTGTYRAFRADLLAAVREKLTTVAQAAALTAGVGHELAFDAFDTPPVINSAAQAGIMRAAAVRALGSDAVVPGTPSMAGDDFGAFLQRRPGAYAWIGNGTDSPGLHLPSYDFNDAILADGAALLATTAELALHAKP